MSWNFSAISHQRLECESLLEIVWTTVFESIPSHFRISVALIEHCRKKTQVHHSRKVVQDGEAIKYLPLEIEIRRKVGTDAKGCVDRFEGHGSQFYQPRVYFCRLHRCLQVCPTYEYSVD